MIDNRGVEMVNFTNRYIDVPTVPEREEKEAQVDSCWSHDFILLLRSHRPQSCLRLPQLGRNTRSKSL